MAEDFNILLEEAKDMFDSGDYEKCEQVLLTLLTDESKKYADIYNTLGFIANQKRQLDTAVEYFEKAIKINPHYTEAALNLAITYNDLGEYAKAEKIFENAVHPAQIEDKVVDPFVLGKLANEHLVMGNKYCTLGMFDNALQEYRKALRLRPHFVDIISKLGVTLREKGEVDEAIRMFQKAISIHKTYIPAYIQLGIGYYAKGFLDMAIETWEYATQIDPTNKAAKVYLSIAIKKEESPENN